MRAKAREIALSMPPGAGRVDVVACRRISGPAALAPALSENRLGAAVLPLC